MNNNDQHPPTRTTTNDIKPLERNLHQDEDAPMPTWQCNQRQRDAQRVKITLDLTQHPQLAVRLRVLAAGEDCGVSSMAAWLLWLGLEHYHQPYKRPARSRLHAYDIILKSGFSS